MKDTEKILHQLKEKIGPIKTNFRIPRILDELVTNKSNDTGRPKVDIIFECFVTLFPEKFEDLVGKEAFNSIIEKVSLFYNTIYNEQGAISLIAYITRYLKINNKEDFIQKKLIIAKHISDIVYSGDGETVNKKALSKILSQKDYAKQVSEALLNSITSICDKAYEEAQVFLTKERFL